MRTCVIIPVFNESRTIGQLVAQIRQHGLEAVVIDDGSRDNSAQIARDNGAVVLISSLNEGKGSALIKGFDYALANGFDAVIAMDGDGQHLPENIPSFLEAAENSEAEMIIGNRMSETSEMPPLRFLTNKFMSWFLSFLAKQRIPDTQCGYRLMKRDLLLRINLTTYKFETESEIIIKAARLGYKIYSLPIKTIYRHERSRIDALRDTVRFIRFIIKEMRS